MKNQDWKSIRGESRLFKNGDDVAEAEALSEMRKDIAQVKEAAIRWEMLNRAEEWREGDALPPRVKENYWPLRSNTNSCEVDKFSGCRFIEPFVIREDAGGRVHTVPNTGWERAKYEMEIFSEDDYSSIPFTETVARKESIDFPTPEGHSGFIWNLEFRFIKDEGKPVYYRWVKRDAKE